MNENNEYDAHACGLDLYLNEDQPPDIPYVKSLSE